MKSFLATMLAVSMLTACSPLEQPATPSPAPATVPAAPSNQEDAALPVTLTMSEDFKTVTIAKGGKSVASVAVENSPESGPEINTIKETSKNIYFSTCTTGFGGYILYRFCYGPSYRFDRVANTVTKILGDGGVYDVSPDEDKFIWLPNGNKDVNKLKVRTVATNQDQVITVSEKYSQYGDAKFSPDGKKVAYAAIVGDSENEEGSVIIVDLVTGKQTYVVKDKSEDVYAIFGWKDANTVDYGAMGGD